MIRNMTSAIRRDDDDHHHHHSIANETTNRETSKASIGYIAIPPTTTTTTTHPPITTTNNASSSSSSSQPINEEDGVTHDDDDDDYWYFYGHIHNNDDNDNDTKYGTLISESLTDDGKRCDRLYSTGIRTVTFTTGLKKVVWPSSSGECNKALVSRTYLPNGDIRSKINDGTELYWYVDGGTRQKTLPDSTDIFIFNTGQKVLSHHHKLYSSSYIRNIIIPMVARKYTSPVVL